MLKNHPLIATLRHLQGNARGCVYTEPLWGIPFNLYSPYFSVYLLALGLRDSQIGFLTSLGMFFQVFWTIVSGAITDKFGRKKTTLIFDLISWSIPCLIWAVAQDFRYFLVAALVNSIWRITHNSWHCLLVEDTDPSLLVDVASWINISGLLAAFFSPIAGLFISRFDLVPTMRGVFVLSFIMMTTKFVATNAMVKETQQGLVRMRETKDHRLGALLRGTPAVLMEILKTRRMLYTAGLMLILGITRMIYYTFWSILVTEKLLIPPEHIALYPFVRSITMLFTFFFIMPKIRNLPIRIPMIVGYVGLFVSLWLLIFIPPHNYWLLLVFTVLDAASMPLAATLLEKLIVVSVTAEERARIMAILNAVVLTATSPFGWIAGRLSETNRSFPFVLSILLCGAGILLTYFAGQSLSSSTRSDGSAFETVTV